MRLGHVTEKKTKSESGVKHELEMKSGHGLLAQIEDNTPVLRQSRKIRAKQDRLAQIKQTKNRQMNNTYDAKLSSSLRSHNTTTNPQSSPSSIPHLIGSYKLFMAHFYSSNTKMKLGSGQEPHPSKVLYIGPSKRLNGYHAPRA
jgi:hypothetical protein